MSSTLIIVAVGVGVASIVAFAATVLVPGGNSSAPEDRLAEMASRRAAAPGEETNQKKGRC